MHRRPRVAARRGAVVGTALDAYGKAAPFGEVAAEERARGMAAQESAE